MRPVRRADAPAILALLAQADIRRSLGVPARFMILDAVALTSGRGEAVRPLARWAIEAPAFCGLCGLGIREDGDGEIWYALSKAARGRGLMSAAVRTTLHDGFFNRGLGVIHASVSGRNAKSQALLERVGFRRLAATRFRLLREEFTAGEVPSTNEAELV